MKNFIRRIPNIVFILIALSAVALAGGMQGNGAPSGLASGLLTTGSPVNVDQGAPGIAGYVLTLVDPAGSVHVAAAALDASGAGRLVCACDSAKGTCGCSVGDSAGA